ncbi:unnamed protein product [Cutaneotrichosporon oleaginosum]
MTSHPPLPTKLNHTTTTTSSRHEPLVVGVNVPPFHTVTVTRLHARAQAKAQAQAHAVVLLTSPTPSSLLPYHPTSYAAGAGHTAPLAAEPS